MYLNHNILVIITTIVIVVTVQQKEMGNDAGNGVHGCAEGDLGGVLVPGTPATSQPQVWGKVRMEITSEILFQVHLPGFLLGQPNQGH